MVMPRSLAPIFFLFLLISTAPAARTTVPVADNLQDTCNKTLFPKVCISSLAANPESRTASPRRLAELSVYVAAEVGTAVAAFANHELNAAKDDALFKCLDSCSDDIEETVAHLSALTRELTDAKFLEVKSWLSSTLGGTSTCEEACKDAPISDVKNAAVTKSFEFEKLLRVTLDLITEASGSMSAEVALPPSALGADAPSYGAPYGAPSPFGGYGSSADAPAYGADAPAGYGASGPSPVAMPSYGASGPSPVAMPSYGTSGPGADVPAPSYGPPGSLAPSSDASAFDADATA
ncbi:uncharacterized protein LOC133892202 [Phragmites australis]|uniref:uncharacterized protein LOC133892202 n=1 Tax=Phragmites australis TaxID=29695 RepID=UPI002D78B188|nr:uncharacterized protein LOC133892202 [Phragmites australis]